MKLEELEVPQQVRRAVQSAELARIWIADGDQVVVISPRRWDDPAVWGVMLVDLAKHVANAYESERISRDVALQRIKAAFDAEWSHATGNAVELDADGPKVW